MKTLLLNLAIVCLIAVFPFVGKAVDKSLVLFFPFEEGNGKITKDLSGHNNTGTLENGVVWAKGKRGNAISFVGGGKNDLVSVKDDASLDGMNQLTIEMWMQPSELGTPNIISKGDNWNIGYHSHLMADGSVYWGYNVPDRINAPAGTVAVNEWTHLTFWFDGGKLWKIYKNGEEVASGVATTPVIPDTKDEILIGGSRLWTSFKGVIDEVAIYNRILTEKEIEQDMEGIKAAAVGSSDKLTITWGCIKKRSYKESL